MATGDVAPDRLGAAKAAAKDFVDLLPLGVEVGVVAFSGDAIVMQGLDTSKLKTKMAIDNTIIAPVTKDQVFGSVNVSLNDKTIINKPEIARCSDHAIHDRMRSKRNSKT